MTLLVEEKYNKIDFLKFLKRRILTYFASVVNTKKVLPYDEYFKSDEFKEKFGDVSISSLLVIKLGITNLKVVTYPTYSTISINDAVMYPDTKIRVLDLCKIINYGNLSVDAYPIFTNVFLHFKINMKKYVNKYELWVG